MARSLQAGLRPELPGRALGAQGSTWVGRRGALAAGASDRGQLPEHQEEIQGVSAVVDCSSWGAEASSLPTPEKESRGPLPGQPVAPRSRVLMHARGARG